MRFLERQIELRKMIKEQKLIFYHPHYQVHTENVFDSHSNDEAVILVNLYFSRFSRPVFLTLIGSHESRGVRRLLYEHIGEES